MFSYSRQALFSIRKSWMLWNNGLPTRHKSLPQSTWQRIKSFNIHSPRRGQRGGNHLRSLSSQINLPRQANLTRNQPICQSRSNLLNIHDNTFADNGHLDCPSWEYWNNAYQINTSTNNSIPVQITTRNNLSFNNSGHGRNQNLIAISLTSTSNEADFGKESERKSHFSDRETGLHFCCVNARSLRNKIEAVTDHIVNENIDICIFTETWLKDWDTTTIAGLSPTGYEFRNFPRPSDRRAGGTGVMFKNSLNVNLSDGNEKQSFEFSEWSVRCRQQVINVVSLYRPPYSVDHPITSRVFFEEFSAYLEDIVMTPGILLITGDFNFHVDCPSDNDAKNFADILQTYGLKQHVHVPTHISGHTLDLIITRSNNDLTVSSPTASVILSDHFFVECNLNIPRPSSIVKETVYRKLKTMDLHEFKSDILESMLCTSTWNNASELASCYESTMSSLLDKHAPLQKKVVVVRPKLPWYTNSLRQLKVKRRKLERRMLFTGLHEDKLAYRNARDEYTKLLSDTRRCYYADLIAESAGDTKKLFDIINSLSKVDDRYGKLPPHDSSQSLANTFGAFFIKKIELVQQDIDKIIVNQPEAHPQHPHSRLESFAKLTEEDVHRIIMSSSNATCRLDPIPTWLAKSCSDVLTPAITRMLNLSFMEGNVPAPWKEAIVKPLLKKPGLDPLLKNYRPVSNLPFVSKVAEKAVINQLMDYCTVNNLLPDNQSSYRKHHSTETALVKVHNDILTSMDRQEITFLILLDLSAAFDTINHSLMMKILENDYGIAGVVKKWFESYLVSRQQRVLIKQQMSDCFELSSGVPQGSCLGPVLFLIYASGLFKVAAKHLTNIHTYADDTQLYLSFKPTSQQNAVNTIEQCITDVRTWLVSNRLLINDSKTEFLIIGSRQQLAKINVESVTVGDAMIKPVTSVRNLGSWFDQHMTMNDHIGKVCSKAFYSLYNLRQIRKFLDDDTCKILVHALVTCHLDYCNALLYDIPQYQLQRLQKVLNAAARLVCRLPKYCHITPVLKDLHWLPVRYRIIFKIILLVFKTLHGLAPIYLKELIHVKPEGHYRLRKSEQLLVPITKCKTFGDRAFSKSGPVLWNSLPKHLTEITDIENFKKH